MEITIPPGPDWDQFSPEDRQMLESAVVNLAEGNGFEDSTEETRDKAREMNGGG